MPFARESAALLFMLAIGSTAQAQSGATVSIVNRGDTSSIDYANAKPAPLPRNLTATTSQIELLRKAERGGPEGAAAFSPGAAGDGLRTPVRLPKSNYSPPKSDGPSSQEFGASGMPFTTAFEKTPDADPYRRAGKLFFVDGGSTFVCSASLVKIGVVVTAAHCVSKFGQNRFYQGFNYVPAYSDGDAPYGEWDWDRVFAPTKYLNGSDSCEVSGVVCQSDVAVIILKPQGGRYAGSSTGYFGYGVNGYSYTGANQALITQLGYPVSLNGGEEMMRTDAQGSVDPSLSGNTVMGSGQTGGSSGGPWVVNFGFAPSPDGSNPFGSDPKRNVVVGVTSWGFNDGGANKQQGASPFLNSNVDSLVKDACKKVKAACK